MSPEAVRQHRREADWRVFRQDVMASLPHAWHGRDVRCSDTRVRGQSL